MHWIGLCRRDREEWLPSMSSVFHFTVSQIALEFQIPYLKWHSFHTFCKWFHTRYTRISKCIVQLVVWLHGASVSFTLNVTVIPLPFSSPSPFCHWQRNLPISYLRPVFPSYLPKGLFFQTKSIFNVKLRHQKFTIRIISV